MKPSTLTPRLVLLLLLAAPAWGQSPPPPAGGETDRPLNLSLPRDVLAPPPAVVRGEPQDSATRNLRQEEMANERRTQRQPYGTGYEARQRGMTAGGGSGGQGEGGGGGGRGRGGMGRGR